MLHFIINQIAHYIAQGIYGLLVLAGLCFLIHCLVYAFAAGIYKARENHPEEITHNFELNLNFPKSLSLSALKKKIAEMAEEMAKEKAERDNADKQPSDETTKE